MKDTNTNQVPVSGIYRRVTALPEATATGDVGSETIPLQVSPEQLWNRNLLLTFLEKQDERPCLHCSIVIISSSASKLHFSYLNDGDLTN